MQSEKQPNRFCSASAVWQLATYVAVATLAAIVTSAYYMASPGSQIADGYVRLDPGAVLLHSNTTIRLVGRVEPPHQQQQQQQQVLSNNTASGTTAAAAAEDGDKEEGEGGSEAAAAAAQTSPAAADAAAAEDDVGYKNLDAHPICSFLASGRAAP
jgi:hypothetical protein